MEWIGRNCTAGFDTLFSTKILNIYQGYLYWQSWNAGDYPPLSLLADVLQSYKLTSLALRNTNVRSLQELFPAKSQLKALHLEGSDKIELLATELKNLPKLESLNLNGIDLTTQDWDTNLLTLLPIHQISLNNCSLSSPSVDDILIKLSETSRKKGLIDIRNNSAATSASASESAKSTLTNLGWKINL